MINHILWNKIQVWKYFFLNWFYLCLLNPSPALSATSWSYVSILDFYFCNSNFFHILSQEWCTLGSLCDNDTWSWFQATKLESIWSFCHNANKPSRVSENVFSFNCCPTIYCKDTEPIYHSFMHSLVSHFFPVSINAFIACYIRRKTYLIGINQK